MSECVPVSVHSQDALDLLVPGYCAKKSPRKLLECGDSLLNVSLLLSLFQTVVQGSCPLAGVLRRV